MILPRRSGLLLGLALLLIEAPASHPLSAQVAPDGGANDNPAHAAQPAPQDGPAYPVSRFEFRYLTENAAHPPLAEVLEATVTLGRTDAGYIAPRDGVPTITRPLAELGGDSAETYYGSALNRIFEAARDALTARKLLGVFVAPDPAQISPDGRDLRPQNQTTLPILITIGRATELRTLAHGDRIDPADRINHPLHQRIGEQSPVQPFDEGDDLAARRDLLRQDLLDDYASFLSRHPGRRVDVALAPAPEIGGVNLDYLVTETKPWLLYAQIANTGTRNTDEWRYQLGFRHYQLTNHDDIFSLDYVTAGFDDTHAVLAGYEAPVGDCFQLRYRLYGAFSEFTASDVGLFGDTFEGESYHGGAELLYNIHQQGDFFLDIGGGLRVEHVKTRDTLPGSSPGDETFIVPYLTLRAERITDVQAFTASVTLERQGGAGVDEAAIDNLGRAGTDHDWVLLRWELSQSLYLEPLLNRAAWEDPSTPQSSTLAHELFVALRGQTSFGRRLIPQYEQVAGGLHTVRGYDESITAGDTVVIGTLEYRYHVPRAFGLEPEPRQLMGGPFRVARQQVYGPTDWDLILRAFVDAGHVVNHSGRGFGGDSETLVGAGVGFELHVKRNLTLRLDWGFALHDVEPITRAGSSQVHFALTLLY